MPFLQAAGRRIEYQQIPGLPGRPTIVFLHEGLGSIALWRDFPARCAVAAGCPALVYSRYGYGQSEPLHEPRRPDYLDTEALEVLPAILDQLEIECPVLFGHSDGASIALLHAGGAGRPVAGVIALAPHVFVEAEAIRGIAATLESWKTTPLREKLARFHDHVDSVFAGWHDIWTAPEFREWNIERYLPRISCPVLVIQGEQDEYGTMAQLDRIAAGVPGVVQLRLQSCGHSPQRDQPERVLAATTDFLNIVFKMLY
jgi:pimeloyl-ACP methyl ester carboxylesterase